MIITWSGLYSSHRDSVWKILEAKQSTTSPGQDKQLEAGQPDCGQPQVAPWTLSQGKDEPSGGLCRALMGAPVHL